MKYCMEHLIHLMLVTSSEYWQQHVIPYLALLSDTETKPILWKDVPLLFTDENNNLHFPYMVTAAMLEISRVPGCLR